MKLFVSALGAALLVSACESGEGVQDDPHAIPADGFATMSASSEYGAAHERYESCMLDAGYPETDSRVGVVLSDGTVINDEPGKSYYYTGAYLEYVLAGERCQDSSGMTAVRQQFGTADPTTEPSRLKQLNDRNVKEYGCMKAKGWDIPEPVTSRGILIFDVRFESEEQRTAYNLEYYRCMAELGTGTFPR